MDYASLIKKLPLPPGFTAPTRLTHEDLEARALTRADLQDVLLAVHAAAENRRVTIVHVTHDVDEAVYLADRILVLTPSPGTVAASVNVGLPRPRTQSATRSSTRFLEVRNEVHDVISQRRR